MREMQIKTTMRYYLIPVRMVLVKRQEISMEKREPLYTLGGNANRCILCKTEWRFFRKLRIE